MPGCGRRGCEGACARCEVVGSMPEREPGADDDIPLPPRRQPRRYARWTEEQAKEAQQDVERITRRETNR